MIELISSEMNSRPAVIIPAPGKHTASLIFLHGLGDVGESWLEEFKRYNILKKFPHVKFIFPTAPIRKITVKNGIPMHGWFDSYGLDRSTQQDEEGIIQAANNLNDLIEKEIKNGIPVERIMIGGFSMGGAVVLYTALISPHTLGGVVALSTWLPLLATFPNALIAGDKKVNLPILHCHGSQDSIVRMYWGRLSEESFKAMGFKQYIFKEYDGMEHTSSNQEMKDVMAFIEQYLPKTD